MSDTLEVVYTWLDGREEVRYRRPYLSDSADVFIDQIRSLKTKFGEECPYHWRIIRSRPQCGEE